MKRWSQEAIFQKQPFYPVGNLFALLLKRWTAKLACKYTELKPFQWHPTAPPPVLLHQVPLHWVLDQLPAPTCCGKQGTKCTWLAQVRTGPSGRRLTGSSCVYKLLAASSPSVTATADAATQGLCSLFQRQKGGRLEIWIKRKNPRFVEPCLRSKKQSWDRDLSAWG